MYFIKNIEKKDKQHESKIKLWFTRFSLKIKYSKIFGYSAILTGLSVIVTAIINILFMEGTDVSFYSKKEFLQGVVISFLPIVVSLIKELIETFKSYRTSFVVNDEQIKEFIYENLESSKDYKTSGYVWRDYNGIKYEMSNEVNNRLSKLDSENKKIIMQISRKKHFVPEEVTKFFDYKIKKKIEENKIIFNGKLVRLSTDLLTQTILEDKKENSKDVIKVKLEKTDYFSNIITNDTIYETCRNKADVDYLLYGYKFCLKNNIEFDKKLPVTLLNLNDNYCANIIGVSTLILAKDNKIVILVQGDSDVNRNKYVPSGSGSAEYSGLKTQKDFFAYLKQEMHREMLEELRISKKIYKEINSQENDVTQYKIQTHIIGYCRLLDRGGKPDFFGLTYMPEVDSKIFVKYFELGKKNSENNQGDHNKKNEIVDIKILNSIRDLEKEEHKDKISLQLGIIKNLIYDISNDENHPQHSLAKLYLKGNE